MLENNVINEVSETAIGEVEITSGPSTKVIEPAFALHAAKAELQTEISHAGPFQEALQITLRSRRSRKEIVPAQHNYVRELSAAKLAEWNANPVVGAVAGYFIMCKFTEVDPTDGIEKERVRSTLLVTPNPRGNGHNRWLNSVYWPNLSCDIDGNRYFRRPPSISLSVVEDSSAIAKEISSAFSDPSMLLALGSFDRYGFDRVWVKPYGYATKLLIPLKR